MMSSDAEQVEGGLPVAFLRFGLSSRKDDDDLAAETPTKPIVSSWTRRTTTIPRRLTSSSSYHHPQHTNKQRFGTIMIRARFGIVIMAALTIVCWYKARLMNDLILVMDDKKQQPLNTNVSPITTTATTGNSTTHQLSAAIQSWNAEAIWKGLLEEGAALVKLHQSQPPPPVALVPGAVFEVGMHKAEQCIEAAETGLVAHCFEPSPKSFARVQRGVQTDAAPDIQARIHLYNMAASSTSVGTVPFKSSGGTGDHVGSHNMWSMEKENSAEQGYDVISVQQVRLDDIVAQQQVGTVFLIKVDTQGFEPSVFSGLTESIRNNKIHFLLFEYWPKGMDFMADRIGDCIAVQKVLQPLVNAGYRLYAMSVQAHPKAPVGWKDEISQRPLGSLLDNCQWYYKVEQLHFSAEYKMGYWSDILAVSPTAPLDNPVTNVGRALMQDRQERRNHATFP